jgi:hypothetical protein
VAMAQNNPCVASLHLEDRAGSLPG